jgi:class 3 adenylate cyclase
MPELGIEVRSGLHTGECEMRGDDIGGIAVHIGARIVAHAQAREVLVSSTVKDLVNGSGITFEDRGTHVLKGIPAQWQLYAPVGEHDPAESITTHAPQPKSDRLADSVGRRPRMARMLMRIAHRN